MKGLCTVKRDNESGVGLCLKCIHKREIKSDKGTIFSLCQLSFADLRFPKYPRLPVLTCSGFKPHAEGKKFRN